MAGWVYILSNPAMPGLFKVGYTDRDPFSRSKEISQATGVPFDFIVEYQIYVSHPYELEQKTHKLLHNHRVNNNREFFNCSYEDVVEAILLHSPVIVGSGPAGLFLRMVSCEGRILSNNT